MIVLQKQGFFLNIERLWKAYNNGQAENSNRK